MSPPASTPAPPTVPELAAVIHFGATSVSLLICERGDKGEESCEDRLHGSLQSVCSRFVGGRLSMGNATCKSLKVRGLTRRAVKILPVAGQTHPA